MNPHTRFTLVGTSVLIFLLGRADSVQAQQPNWSVTGSLGTPRRAHTATLLANGKVLVAGGREFLGNSPPSWRGIEGAELYDPATGRWSATGSLSTPRGGHLAVRLTNGKVLVVGGDNGYDIGVTTAEIYDPETGTWSGAGSISVPRMSATATLLADGWVLVAGGKPNRFSSHSSAELYDPATGAWRPVGLMTTVRSGHTATLLPGGKVLVVGGAFRQGLPESAELYDPTTGKWTATGSTRVAHLWDHQVVLLPSGNVLVSGGGIDGDDFCNGVDSAELYDPATGRWSPTDKSISTRNDYSHNNYATVLPNGKVLVVGGLSPGCNSLDSADLYDPATGSWSATASLKTFRSGHTVTLLTNGKVLVAGGGANSAELFDSGAASVTSVSAASFVAGGALAPESIASGFGASLAANTQIGASDPPLTQMAGVSVKVRDRTGTERVAPLFFVSPAQINYQIPGGTAVGGLATVTVNRGESLVAAGLVEIAGVAPGFFAGAAQVLRVRADGTQQVEPVTSPIDLGPASDQVFLILYGTGIRSRSALAAVNVTVGGVSSDVLYAGAAPGLVGLDQVNLRLSRSLAGRGEVEVALSADGKAANPVRITIR